MGGSVALASKELNLVDKISLWVRRSDAISELVEADIADHVSDDFQEIIPDADLIVFATPVGTVGDILRKIIPIAKPML